MRSVVRTFRQHWRELVGAVLLGGASLGAAVGLLATSAWLISMASTRPPVLVLEVAIVSVRFFGLSRGVLKYASRILEHNGALKVQTVLRVKIYERFSRLLPSDYADLHRGNLLNQIINDVELSQDLWLRIASPWFAALISGTAGVTIIHWLLPSCGEVIGLIFLATSFLVPFLAMLASSKADTRKYESTLFDQILQIAESAPESLIFDFGGELLTQIDTAQEKIAKVEAKNGVRSGFAAALYYLSLGSAVVISLWFAADAALSHHLAGINVAVISLVPLAMFDGLSTLPTAFSQLRQVIGAIKNIEPLLQEMPLDPVEVEEISQSVTLEFRKFHPVLEGARTHEISAKVEPGHTLLITGRSGSGKSSIINAALGFLPYNGELLINDEPMRSAHLNSISTLLQDDYLFGTSIRENLKIGNPEATDDRLFEVLAIVELEEFVRALPGGLDTMIGSQGYNFSGGEKQRLKLARLLLRDTPVFILDEPYEFLDSKMVERISLRVNLELREKTVIVVSHLPLPISATTITL